MLPFQGLQEELAEATRKSTSGIIGKQTWFIQNRILLGLRRPWTFTLLFNGFWKSGRRKNRVKLLANREVTGLPQKRAEIRDKKISEKQQTFPEPT